MWLEYFTPLEQLIQEFRHKYPNDSELINELDKDQIEIDKCKSNSVVISYFCNNAKGVNGLPNLSLT
ncbi:unnamed protein product [marine sediment metagenome]|uniref:Uncharacterized protein n=1 Tax=marine sediment metagenome TaxID=412755 RepID=X1J4R3_9ZZZZ